MKTDAQCVSELCSSLDRQPVGAIAGRIAELGFNCVRLVFALDTFYKNPIIREERLTANVDLVGKTAMEVFDVTVEALTEAGLIVILNNHVSLHCPHWLEAVQ